MIGRLRGQLVDKSGETILLDVGGVGYEVLVAPGTLVDLPGVGEDAVVHTHLHVREDVQALYGFTSRQARDLFRLLIGVSGVGPKVAMAILGTMSPDDLRRAVVNEDVDALTMVPGIGKRSAAKLMLELRPRLELPDLEVVSSNSSAVVEVRGALEGLGYDASEIREALASLPHDLTVEDLLRRSLQRLGQGE
jgi:Holliday junction DNA helicase RuvA